MSDSGSFPPPPGSDRGGESLPPPPGGGEPSWGDGGGQGWSGGQPGPGGQPSWGEQPGAAGQPGWGGPGERRNAPALASLITGITSLVCLLLFFLILTIPIAIICAIAALVTGVIGLRASRDPVVGGRGQAIGGIVTGAITLVLVVLVTVAALAAWNTLGFDANPFSDPEAFLEELEQRGVEVDEEGNIDPDSVDDLFDGEA